MKNNYLKMQFLFMLVEFPDKREVRTKKDYWYHCDLDRKVLKQFYLVEIIIEEVHVQYLAGLQNVHPVYSMVNA
jgi:hypothetical protein